MQKVLAKLNRQRCLTLAPVRVELVLEKRLKRTVLRGAADFSPTIAVPFHWDIVFPSYFSAVLVTKQTHHGISAVYRFQRLYLVVLAHDLFGRHEPFLSRELTDMLIHGVARYLMAVWAPSLHCSFAAEWSISRTGNLLQMTSWSAWRSDNLVRFRILVSNVDIRREWIGSRLVHVPRIRFSIREIIRSTVYGEGLQK
ncbi:hypothetical protein XA68_10504 [Ophiocordyceps unilateralis]|uniref:Uncharacterized protein n=1 Tax=Ophiocordyceps unilateralis TaxID=268505 RepID=A0A2A9PGT0_OPHUN|nr:hypothetical protein XA68_10504 [Ophiocordyceps unilateralis]